MKRRGQRTHDQGGQVKRPLFPNVVRKKEWDKGHDKSIRRWLLISFLDAKKITDMNLLSCVLHPLLHYKTLNQKFLFLHPKRGQPVSTGCMLKAPPLFLGPTFLGIPR